MLFTTLPWLRCPNFFDGNPICGGQLSISEIKKQKAKDIILGTLKCDTCEATFPILAGVAILVNDVESYLRNHVKGVSALVRDQEIPDTYKEIYLHAKSELEIEFTEEDLESQRINSLYYMNHYLTVRQSKESPWWKPEQGPFSNEINQLIRKYWDHGPFLKIAEWTQMKKKQSVIEIGCGVGGLAQVLAKTAESYLGVDSAFASIALARHIYHRAPYALSIRFPQDLYNGPLTGKTKFPKFSRKGCNIDFVVGELENLPVVNGRFDLAIVLNAIDMIPDPWLLPKLQYDLIKPDGIAIQSGPYIWHKSVAEKLREALPAKIKSSSEAVEYLYNKSGFTITKHIDHLPWLFLKHFRQIEMYSVHLFMAKKASKR